jgi:hypothetical protein
MRAGIIHRAGIASRHANCQRCAYAWSKTQIKSCGAIGRQEGSNAQVSPEAHRDHWGESAGSSDCKVITNSSPIWRKHERDVVSRTVVHWTARNAYAGSHTSVRKRYPKSQTPVFLTIVRCRLLRIRWRLRRLRVRIRVGVRSAWTATGTAAKDIRDRARWAHHKGDGARCYHYLALVVRCTLGVVLINATVADNVLYYL